MGRQSRRAARVSVEPVEPRALLSGLVASLESQPRFHPSLTGLFAAATGNGLMGAPSALLGQGQQTPAELARERFQATFSGPFSVGPGRFTDQRQTVFMRGVGTSNFFHHGNYTVAIVTPTDPNAPLRGLAILNDKNTNDSGILGLDLTGDPHDVDSRGRPLHMTFVSDPNIYSGGFFVSASNGTLDIRYHPGNVASVKFQGLVFTTGLTNPLKNADLVSRGGRISP